MITEAKPISREEQQRLNAEFGMRLNRETRANSNSPYAGKYVIIADCEVVTIGDTLDDIHDKIVALGMNPRETFYIQASADYDQPIWMPARISFDSLDFSSLASDSEANENSLTVKK